MDILITILLGIIQGLTEFIPISSSGHLMVFQHFFEGTTDHLFVEFINIGTFLALVVYFRHRIIDIVRECITRHNYRLIRNIILTSLPAGIVGYLVADYVDQLPIFGNMWLIAAVLAGVGMLMVVLERLPRAAPVADGEQLSALRALIIGLVQMCALIPGVSRSGSTIIAGRLSGLSHEKAAEYSFIASLPIMAAVTLKLFIKSADREYIFAHLPAVIIGNIFAFIAGILAVGFLIKYLSRHDLRTFGCYRIAFAGVIVIMLLIQSS